MTDLLNRVVIVRAGLPGQKGRAWSNQGEGALKIVFEVEASTSKRPNKATIDMWNLSEDSRGFLGQAGLIVTLEVGYRGFTNVLAVGDAADRDVTFEAQDTVTRLTLGDGEVAYLRAQFNRSFGAGTSSTEIVEQIRSAMGIGAGFVDPDVTPITYPNGATFTGDARDALDRVIANIDGAEWSIQQGALQILGGNAQPTAARAVLLDPPSGLLSAKEVKGGVEVTSLLIPTITPGRVLDVRGRTVRGLFVVRKAKHAGNGLPQSAGDGFRTVCTARRRAA